MYNIPLFDDFFGVHVLIGGTPGSGKSVLLDDMIFHIASKDPRTHKLVIIDPKRVSFMKWESLPHIIRYSDEKPIAYNPDEITNTLETMVDFMENRYTYMMENRIEKITNNPVYVIIDELANVMLDKKNHTPLYRLLTLGRAADIHVIAATQNPSRKVLPGEMQCCFEGVRIGLHCSATESRMIIGSPDCDKLPDYGKMIVKKSGRINTYDVPLLDPETIQNQINEWIVAMAINKSFK